MRVTSCLLNLSIQMPRRIVSLIAILTLKTLIDVYSAYAIYSYYIPLWVTIYDFGDIREIDNIW